MSPRKRGPTGIDAGRPSHGALRTAAFLDNLARWTRGQPLLKVVDPEAGY